MKKSLLALAVLGTFAGVASAQSTVTLNGTMDLNARSVKNGNAGTLKSMGTDGINSSQLVFSGREDMGGGLFAGFVLNSGVGPDTGTNSGGAKFWNRRATASLMGGFGEVRLGRDYTPTFLNISAFDPFGTNGIGTTTGVFGASALGSNATTVVRADNSIGYFLPAMGGLNGQFMVSANEGSTGPTGNKYIGGKLGFNAGPIALGAAAGQTTVLPNETKLKMYSIAGSYNIGFVKPNITIGQSKLGNVKQSFLQVGATATMGQGDFRVAFNKINNSGGTATSQFAEADDNTHFAIGYVHNLSKRTGLYGTIASLKNKGNSRQTVAGGNAGIQAGGKSTGYEFGMRHFF